MPEELVEDIPFCMLACYAFMQLPAASTGVLHSRTKEVSRSFSKKKAGLMA